MKAKMFSRLCLASAFILLGSGCTWMQVEKKRFTADLQHLSSQKGACGSVAFITYSPASGRCSAGAIQCVFAAPSDATHRTTWQMKRLNNHHFEHPAHLVGSGPIPAGIVGRHDDYEIQITPDQPDKFLDNPVVIRAYRGQLATIAIIYQSCDNKSKPPTP